MMRRADTIALGILLWCAVAGALGGASVALAPGRGGGGAGGASASSSGAGGSGGEEKVVHVVREGARAPSEVAADETGVFWLETPREGLGAIDRADKDGANYRRLAEVKTPSELVLAGDYLVFASFDGAHGDVLRVNKSGPTALQTIAKNADPCGIATFEGNVYWTDAQGRVRRARAEGGPAATLAQGQDRPCAIAVDEEGIFWVNRSTGEPGTSSVVRGSLDGAGKPTVLAAREYGPMMLKMDATHVYWATIDGQIKSAPKNGDGEVKALYTTHHTLVIGMVEDGDVLYWAGGGGVWSQPKSGGDPTGVMTEVKTSRGVATDDVNVYAVDMGSGEAADGRILSVSK